MDVNAVVTAVGVISGMGLLLGVGLDIAGTYFAVPEDERLPQIMSALPGANCGGCGYAGCEALAKAILAGDAAPNECPVGGATTTEAVSAIMGIEPVLPIKKVAFIRCGGSSTKSEVRYEYDGEIDCYAIRNVVGGGSKSCIYGCLGGGTCIKACQFGAIKLVDGIAVVDKEKCTACNMCVNACPKTLITMLPYNNTDHVKCLSFNTGKETRKICTIGCIGCKMCEKVCKFDAIKVDNNLAIIDYEKCTMCNECVKKCPTKCIINEVDSNLLVEV